MKNPKRIRIRLPELDIPVWWPSAPINWRSWLPAKGTVLFTLLLLAALLWAQNAGAITLGAQSAGAPAGAIPYQGRLADASGAPLTSVVGVIFRLYGAATGGVPLWEEQWTGSNSVAVSDGLFNVMLGSINPIPQELIANSSALFLGITVGSDDEMTPRIQLGSVPYAVQALTVPDGSITTAKVANGAITAGKLAAGISFAPPGTIVMWSGSLAAIPPGWALCDGANGTPDLRDRFVLSVAAGEEPGATGGSHTATPSGTISGGEHTHSGQTGNIGTGGNDGARVDGGGYPAYYAHTHAFTTGSTTPQMAFAGQQMDIRPKYYKLAFIMKL